MKRIAALTIVLASLGAPALADSLIWMTPIDATLTSGNAVLAPGPAGGSVRVVTGAPSPTTAIVEVALPSLQDGATIDSLIVCYRTAPPDVGQPMLISVELRMTKIPTAHTQLLSHGVAHVSTEGECLALDVADVVASGFLSLRLGVGLLPQSPVDIGAIGIKLKTPVVGVMPEPRFDAGASAIELAPGRPTPTREGAFIDFRLASAARVTLDIVDVGGRTIRRLANGEVAAGPHTLAWNGRDDAGSMVAPGVYFMRLSDGVAVRSEKLVVAR